MCDHCGADNPTKSCSACHEVYYCDRDCQINDWLHHKEVCCGRKTFNIWIKTDSKSKVRVILNREQSGAELIRSIAKQMSFHPERLKIISKGKLLSDENAVQILKEGSVCQAIGEKIEDGSGLSDDDINIMMKQLAIGRNEAIRALRQNEGNLIDAMLFQSKSI